MQKSNFALRSEVRGQVVVLYLEGFLDDTCGQELSKTMEKKIEEKFIRFVLDFQKVRNISSPAVAALLDMAEKVTDSLSGKVIIAGASELNLKIFEMVGIFLYADASPTVQDAEAKALQ